MYPSVKQSITSICKALEEIVIPELKDSAFASEQAAMMAAQLKQITDVAEDQHQYLLVELADTLSLLKYWQSSIGITEQTCPVFYRSQNTSNEAMQKMMFVELQDLLLELKVELNLLIDKKTVNKDSEIDTELARYINRQLERETSWFRLSGFIGNADEVPAIADVLKQQSANHF